MSNGRTILQFFFQFYICNPPAGEVETKNSNVEGAYDKKLTSWGFEQYI